MRDLASLREFLGRFARFQSGHQAMRISELKTGFAGIAQALVSMRALTQETDRLTGRRFNVFDVLGIGHLEVQTHSRLLRELLDPEGCHGQGDHFLRLFLGILTGLRSVHKKIPFPNITDSARSWWRVTTEKATEWGNLDIVLESSHAVLAIENKIYAGDQKDQLSRYATWLGDMDGSKPVRALFYLTLDGHESVSAGGADYYKLSYRQEITDWLGRCVQDVTAPRIRDTLEQYLGLIPSLLRRDYD